METSYYDVYKYCQFYSACHVGKYWYVPAIKQNAVYRINRETKNLERVIDLKGCEGSFYEGLYALCIGVGNTIVFLPQNTNTIAIYDVIKEELKEIPIIKEGKNQCFETVGCALKGKYIYIYSIYEDKAPIVLNMEEYSITYDSGWKKAVEKYSRYRKSHLITSIIQDGDTILAGVYGQNIIFEYSLITHKIIKEIRLDSGFKINKIFLNKDMKEVLYITNIEGGRLCIYNRKEEKHYECDLPVNYLPSQILFGKSIFMISYNSDEMLISDYTFSQISLVKISVSDFRSFDEKRLYYAGEISDGKIYFFPFRSNGVISYNIETGKKEFISTHVKENVKDILARVRNNFWQNNKSAIIDENIWPLSDYILDLDMSIDSYSVKVECGKQIYTEVK